MDVLVLATGTIRAIGADGSNRFDYLLLLIRLIGSLRAACGPRLVANELQIMSHTGRNGSQRISTDRTGSQMGRKRAAADRNGSPSETSEKIPDRNVDRIQKYRKAETILPPRKLVNM